MARKDIEQAIEDVKAFDQSVANLTLDRANEAKKEETELQVPLSTKEIEKSKDITDEIVREFRLFLNRQSI